MTTVRYYIITLFFLFYLPLAHSLVTKTIYNPYTQAQDYIRNENLINYNESACTDSQVLKFNDTTNKWFCSDDETAGAGSGDITAVNTNGPYLSGGATIGAVTLVENGTYFNETVSRIRNYTSYDNNLTINSDTNVIRLIGTWFLNTFSTKSELGSVNSSIPTNASINLSIDNRVTQNFIENLGFVISSTIKSWISGNFSSLNSTLYSTGNWSFDKRSYYNVTQSNETVSALILANQLNGSENISVANGRIFINKSFLTSFTETDPLAIKNNSVANLLILNTSNISSIYFGNGTHWFTLADLINDTRGGNTSEEVQDTIFNVIRNGYAINVSYDDTNNLFYITVNISGLNSTFATDIELDSLTLLRTANASLFLQNSSVSGSANVSIDSAGRIYINTSLGSGTSGNNYYPTGINFTTLKYQGNITNGSFIGYQGATSICNNTYANSHLCTEFEVSSYISYYTTIGRNMSQYNGNESWVIAGGSKYPTTQHVNDCNGFKWNQSITYYGTFWHFETNGGGDSRATSCDSRLYITCCLY